MPLSLIQHKSGHRLNTLAEKLAQQLPRIVASALTLPDRKELDGLVNPEDIIVRCVEGRSADVNTKDLEIIIWAHDFPERLANLEERKDQILQGVRDFLREHDQNVSGFVWILLQPTAFGTF